MGFFNTADDMATNSMKMLSDVLDSKFTSFLSGQGTPVLVDYYNVNETMSTLDNGTYTVDKILGDNSPLRYNEIKDLPVVGLREIIPEFNVIEHGLIDLSIDIDITLFPNTVKPNAYDYFAFYFKDEGNHSLTFKVTEFELSSIKNNSYYKLKCSLKDINDLDTVNKLKKQVVTYYTTVVDNIGSQDKCIIKNDIYNKIESIKKIRNHLVEEYLDVFYDTRYKCLLCRNDGSILFPIYDPYLTRFVSDHNILDYDRNYIVLSQMDHRLDKTREYNKSFYRNVELRDTSKLVNYIRLPITFDTKDTNPFYYYGEETVFSIQLELPSEKITNQSKFDYVSRQYIDYINGIEQDYIHDDIDCGMNVVYIPWYIELIKSFITSNTMFEMITDEMLKYIVEWGIDDNRDNFIYIPMIIYILNNYLDFLNNNK